MKRELERIEIPGEHEARVRSLAVVRAAFAEREPRRGAAPGSRSRRRDRARRRRRPAEPARAGRARRHARGVGVEKAQPAAFSLPAPGRLLVTADSGAWVVEEDGSKRLLGRYREASWSPFGRFVVARARTSWSRSTRRRRALVARPAGRPLPALGRHRDGHAHRLSLRGQLRVVGGDGTGDRLLDRQAAAAPVWQPGRGHRLAYPGPTDGASRRTSTRGRFWIVTRRRRWRRKPARKILLRTIGSRPLRPAGPVARRPLARRRLARRRPVRLPGGRPAHIGAVSNVSSQFRSRSLPTISGWCCAP